MKLNITNVDINGVISNMVLSSKFEKKGIVFYPIYISKLNIAESIKKISEKLSRDIVVTEIVFTDLIFDYKDFIEIFKLNSNFPSIKMKIFLHQVFENNDDVKIRKVFENSSVELIFTDDTTNYIIEDKSSSDAPEHIKKLAKFTEPLRKKFVKHRDNREELKNALIFNDYLWSYGINVFKSTFKDKLSYGHKFKNCIYKINNLKEKFRPLEDSKNIIKVIDKQDNKIALIAITDDLIGFVEYYYEDFDVYIIMPSWGNYDIKFKDEKAKEKYSFLYEELSDFNPINNYIMFGKIEEDRMKIEFLKKSINSISKRLK